MDEENPLNLSVSILIADDHAIFRMGLKSLLKRIPYIISVDEAENGAIALKMLKRDDYDILLLDIEMPVKNGIETLRELRKTNKNVKVLPLSMSSNEKYLIEMRDSGANGYLLKNTTREELKRAIELLMEGESYYTPEVKDKLFKSMLSRYEPNEYSESVILTRREEEIIMLICEQYSAAEIAEKLCISDLTVKSHRQNLFDKLKIKNTAGLVIYAIQAGLYSLKK